MAVTPNGYADGVGSYDGESTKYFILPEEKTMKMGEFLDNLDNPQ